MEYDIRTLQLSSKNLISTFKLRPCSHVKNLGKLKSLRIFTQIWSSEEMEPFPQGGKSLFAFLNVSDHLYCTVLFKQLLTRLPTWLSIKLSGKVQPSPVYQTWSNNDWKWNLFFMWILCVEFYEFYYWFYL